MPNTDETRRRYIDDRLRMRWAFSLLEVVFVLLILTIVAALAAPRFANALAGRRAAAAAQQVAADLSFARHRARFTSKSLTIKFSPAARQYTILGMVNPDRPTQSYTVSLADEPFGVTGLVVSLGGDGQIIFDGYGVPDSGGTITIQVGGETKTVTLDGTTNAFVPIRIQ